MNATEQPLSKSGADGFSTETPKYRNNHQPASHVSHTIGENLAPDATGGEAGLVHRAAFRVIQIVSSTCRVAGAAPNFPVRAMSYQVDVG